MKYASILVGMSILMFPACSSKEEVSAPAKTTYAAPTPAKQKKFQETMVKVAMSTKENPNYKRMSLDTPEKKTWFKSLMYRLWDRQITRAQFVSEGLVKYPKHTYEFSYIGNGFQRF